VVIFNNRALNSQRVRGGAIPFVSDVELVFLPEKLMFSLLKVAAGNKIALE